MIYQMVPFPITLSDPYLPHITTFSKFRVTYLWNGWKLITASPRLWMTGHVVMPSENPIGSPASTDVINYIFMIF